VIATIKMSGNTLPWLHADAYQTLSSKIFLFPCSKACHIRCMRCTSRIKLTGFTLGHPTRKHAILWLRILW
jgi:hypothetical protein